MIKQEALRILLVEDSPSDAKLVMHELRRLVCPITFERVQTAAAMRQSLSQTPRDVIISDWSMPEFSARGALDVMHDFALDLPFIIVSGTVGEEAAVEAMRAGAHDYVLKDRLGRLVPAVERELRECQERVRHREGELRRTAITHMALDAIVAFDDDGRFTDFNPAAEMMFGCTKAAALGRSIWEFVPNRDLLTKLLENDSPVQGIRVEAWANRENGTPFPVEIALTHVGAERNAFFGFIRDISERMLEQRARQRAEEALRQSEQQLRHAQKMDAVGRLAGGVAHDFNNVLSVILSYSELILSDLDAAETIRQDVEEIRKAATRAAGLTRQLLLFSREQTSEALVLDLNDVIRNMEAMLRRVVGEDVELAIGLSPRVGRVCIDPTHIEQVIMNLVVNARDAMPRGGKVFIETEEIWLDDHFTESHTPAAAGHYVMLAVRDTGTGMDGDTQARIFEPFFTTKDKGKGTGLGLSTVFGIVRQNGGGVWVESEPGKGSSFKVYVPRVYREVDPVRSTVSPTTLIGSETILLVEDEDQVRAVALNALERRGYEVLPARDGVEALLICERHAGVIDLLLTDVIMPQMSGPDLARRAVSIRPTMKILCMSGYTEERIVSHGVRGSGMAFLQKPITPGTLATRVREVLDTARDTAFRV